ncbi:MAG TPA: glycosyltransferase family 2 protein, partial [Humisphaera sp.]|nr:glycosyltransferase family 2 protein [Humisphaera sp.]
MKQSVSLCMIVRDEEANLAGCLEGVAGLFDEVIVVDTGSIDGTRQVAARFGAKVFDFPWIDDFAAARNESRRHATGQWIFWLDADDRVDAINRGRLAELLENLPEVNDQRNPIFSAWCKCSLPDFSDADLAVKHGRLFPNRPDLAWTGRIHERIMPAPGAAAVEMVQTDVTIYHSGYADTQERARKIQRNARLIEREYLLDPDDALTLYYLARQRMWQGRYSESIHLAKRSVENDPSDMLSTTPHCFVMAADCEFKLKRLEKAVELTRQGLDRFPENLAIIYQRGCFLSDLKQMREAAACLARVIDAGREKLALAGMHAETQLPIAHMTLGNIHRAEKK